MTKYQVVARSPDGLEVQVGDPEPFMSLAEIHAEELRAVLRFVPQGGKVQLRVEPVEAA